MFGDERLCELPGGAAFKAREEVDMLKTSTRKEHTRQRVAVFIEAP
jgi:hypothetical protein